MWTRNLDLKVVEFWGRSSFSSDHPSYGNPRLKFVLNAWKETSKSWFPPIKSFYRINLQLMNWKPVKMYPNSKVEEVNERYVDAVLDHH